MGVIQPVTLLGISGSLREASTNTELLKAMRDSSDDKIRVELLQGTNAVPNFNVDDEGARTPDTVIAIAQQVERADGLIFSVPEYAHGIPGALKNLLDWLVSREEFPNKPVFMVHASNRGAFVRKSLAEVLRTMSANLLDEDALTIHLMGKTPQQISHTLNEEVTLDAIDACLKTIARALQ